jgi:hypothetical protein
VQLNRYIPHLRTNPDAARANEQPRAQAAAEMGSPTLGPGTVLAPPPLLPGAPPPPGLAELEAVRASGA